MPDYAKAYNEALVAARRQMFAADGPRARLLRTLYREYAAMLVRIDAEASAGVVTADRAASLRRSIRRELRRLEQRLTASLGDGALEAAELAVRGHAGGLERVRSLAAAEVAQVSVATDFASVPREALEQLMVRRGVGLSETFQTLVRRNVTAAAEDIDRAITSAVGRGVSNQRLTTEIAAQLARDERELKRALRSLGPRGGRTLAAIEEGVAVEGPTLSRAKHLLFDARRIAVSEINNAYLEAHTIGHVRSPVVDLVRWQTSARHASLASSPDICDLYEEADLHGLGPGLYTPQNVPGTPHPFCQCWTSAVLKDPEAWGSLNRPAAEPRAVSEDDVRSYFGRRVRGREDERRTITDAYVRAQTARANAGLQLADANRR